MDLFTNAAVLVALAALLIVVLRRLGQSSIVAYLALGVLAGPSGLRLMASDTRVMHLAEAGVVLLLFFLGLDFHVSALQRMARIATVGAALQVGMTTLVAALLLRLLGWETRECLIAGVAVALSSTAIVMKVFMERQEEGSYTANAALAVLLGQDVVALVGVAALPILLGADREEEPSGGIGGVAGLLVLLVTLPLLFMAARYVLPRLFRRLAFARNAEAFQLASIGACLLVAVAAHQLGASLAIGAFLGGLVFADTPYAAQIRADLSALRDLALGFFFVTVGMLVDLDYVADHALALVAAVPLVIVLKALIAGAVLRAMRYPLKVAAAVGVALSQVGEFAFVLSTAAMQAGGLTAERHQFLIAVSVVTMLPAPALVAHSRQLAGQLIDRWRGRDAAGEAPPDAPAKAAGPSAVVVGYGPVGRTLCDILRRFGIRPCVVDLNLNTVLRLRSLGREAVYGDASRRDVLVAAGLPAARFLLVTLPDYASRVPVLAVARAVNHDVLIMTRARYLIEREGLEQAGADDVAFEECEVAAELARELLQHLAADAELVEHEIHKLREEITRRTGFTMAMPPSAPPAAPPGAPGRVELQEDAPLDQPKRPAKPA